MFKCKKAFALRMKKMITHFKNDAAIWMFQRAGSFDSQGSCTEGPYRLKSL